MNPGGTLWLIDPHEGRFGVSVADIVARRAMGRATGANNVVWVRCRSTDVGAAWADAHDFVLIGGDHSEYLRKKDWPNFSPHVVRGGRVAFHDSAVYRAVTLTTAGSL